MEIDDSLYRQVCFALTLSPEVAFLSKSIKPSLHVNATDSHLSQGLLLLLFLLFLLYSPLLELSSLPPSASPLSSRQRYVLGDNAMHQMAQSSVFLSGMGGLGIEIGRPIFKVPFYTSAMCLTLHSWCFASEKFDTERLTFVFTAKNIVLAGVKVCKPSIVFSRN